MKILGLDPGTRKVGFGLIEKNRNKIKVAKYGVISTGRASVAERLKFIFIRLQKLLEKEKPNQVALEKIFFNKDPIATIKIGEARGVIQVSASLHNIQIFEYTTSAVRKAVTGSGRADKEEVKKMICLLLGIEGDLPEDASDALALAYCHCNKI
jgi:crossover junction endodeoxyribonuclease RuvC